MSARRPRAKSSNHAIAADDFPALRGFLDGYLHEDFVEEHASAEGAVRAFARDANAAELTTLQAESSRLAERIDQWSWADARRALRSLGGRWAPGSRAALKSFLAEIAKARPTTHD